MRRRELAAHLGPGARAGLPLGAAGLLLGISFGVVAEPVMGHIAPIVMSAIVFAGAAQFAATAVLADGGSAAAAIVAGILLNLRFIPMGIAIAPSLRGRRASRAATGQGMVDASWAMAHRGEGRYDIPFMLGATSVQYPAWVAGAAIGVLAGDVIGNPEDLGLDAIFPAFFLALLANELRDGMSAGAALIGAALALSLTPFVPAGIPVLAACAGAAHRIGGTPMREVWITIAALAVATALIKASGPLVFGGRSLPPAALRVISLLAAALLAALVVTQTFTEDGELVLDARAAGLVAAAGALALRRSLVVTMLSAAVATALVRAVT